MISATRICKRISPIPSNDQHDPWKISERDRFYAAYAKLPPAPKKALPIGKNRLNLPYSLPQPLPFNPFYADDIVAPRIQMGEDIIFDQQMLAVGKTVRGLQSQTNCEGQSKCASDCNC